MFPALFFLTISTIALALAQTPTSTPPPTPTQYTNLPPPEEGLFTSSARVLISNTTVPLAWSALTNFPAYASWNPFVRRAVVVSPLNITLPDQYPVVGYNLYLRNQIPPLPFPVDESTPDNILATQFAYEEITTANRAKGRLAWKYTPEEALRAERWQAISDAGEGRVLYESREVFSGPLAGVLKAAFEDGLQKGFDAQGEGLKRLLEGAA